MTRNDGFQKLWHRYVSCAFCSTSWICILKYATCSSLSTRRLHTATHKVDFQFMSDDDSIISIDAQCRSSSRSPSPKSANPLFKCLVQMLELVLACRSTAAEAMLSADTQPCSRASTECPLRCRSHSNVKVVTVTCRTSPIWYWS